MLDELIGTRFSVGDYQRIKGKFTRQMDKIRVELNAAKTEREREVAEGRSDVVLDLWSDVLGELASNAKK